MNSIDIILKIGDRNMILYPLWEYLYPYFLRFAIKHNINMAIWDTKNMVYIPENKQEELISMLESVFEELMEECYKEPTQRQRTKHPSHFQKIFFKDKKYILNYSIGAVGVIGYRLFYIINEISRGKYTNSV